MKHILIAPEAGAPDALQAFVVPDTRAAIELAVEAFIQRLDEGDGDPDLEDDEAGMTAIDPQTGRYLGETKIGDGGPLAKEAEDAEHGWTEWHTRGARKDYGGFEAPNLGWQGHEDVEDDDPDHGLDEGESDFRRPSKGEGPGCAISDPGELCGDEEDGNSAEDEAGAHVTLLGGPGCPISDPGGTALGGLE